MSARIYTTLLAHCVLVMLAVIWVVVGLPGESLAVDTETANAALQELPGLFVWITPLKPEVEQAGLSMRQLQTDVELRLRQAGIRVFTKEEGLQTTGRPWLFVNINIFRHPSLSVYVYNIYIQVRQGALLLLNSAEVDVSTWETPVFTGTTVYPHDIRNSARDQVDQFINAYLSVNPSMNPRPAGIAAPSSASLRRDLIRQVQQRLQAVGFNPGTVDGAMGPQTRDALRWFQNTKGLRPTGEPDEATLDALGVR